MKLQESIIVRIMDSYVLELEWKKTVNESRQVANVEIPSRQP